MADGGLRNTFRTWLPEFHFQAIESALTGGGIPDLNGCYDGAEFWVETKWTQGFVVEVRTKQAVWIKRRVLAGGRAFIAVRRVARPGPRRGGAVDDLFLYHGRDVDRVARDGLDAKPLGCWGGGPARWDWPLIARTLTDRPWPPPTANPARWPF
jgi:hypothetical protein